MTTGLVTPEAATPLPLRSRISLPLLCVLGVSAAAWAIALPSLSRARLSEFGLLRSASPLFLGSMIVTVGVFLASVRARRMTETACALLTLTLMQRLPTVLATDAPLYSWTYKHLGVVDEIQKNGSLVHGLDIYQGWPGLFAITAWFSDLTGLDPITIAHWFTPALHLVLVGLVYAMARVWRLNPMPALVASFIVETLNWVAQDYYSPQAVAFALAIGFLILVGAAQQRAIAVPLMLLIFASITITHQLTPYWLIICCLLLTVFKKLRPRWMVGAMIAMAGLFLAFNYDTAGSFSLLSLDPLQNVQSNVPTVGVFGQRVTSLIVRGLSVTLWLSAVAALWWQRRRGRKVLAFGVLALSSFVLLGGQSYGGEAIFRVFLYSLPGCALLIAPVLTDALTNRRWWVWLAASVIALGCVVASFQGFYGGWFANRMSKAQVDESRILLAQAGYPAYLTVAAPVWPERSSADYIRFAAWTNPGEPTYDYPMIYSAKLTGTDFGTDAEYAKFIEAVGNRDAPTYLIITKQMAIYDWYFGILPQDALVNLQARMRVDPRWSIDRETADFVIFKSTAAMTVGG